jgi:CubicO group peptidase (beta-lactamase class C family)
MMKAFQRFLLVIGIAAVLVAVVWVSPWGYLLKGVRLTYMIGQKSANYLDYTGFDTREIANDPSKVSPLVTLNGASEAVLSEGLVAMLDKTESGSFLVFRNDTLVCEKYFEPVDASVPTNSFSMAKTITCILVEQAIERGEILSWDEPVRKFLPWVGAVKDVEGYQNEVLEENAKGLTLRHLITMTAGLEWNESYVSPFGITAKAYYGSDIEATMRQVPVVVKPGEVFEYQSGATQLLGLVLEKATGKHLAELASERIWKPLGMEEPATWSLDKEKGRELNFCCVNARARDFGRLGLMVMHHGKGLIDSGFLAMAQQPFVSANHPEAPRSLNYGYAFWLGEVDGVKFSYFQGLKGQYIVMIPSRGMVVVRTGNGIERAEDGGKVFDCVKTYVSEAIKLFGPNPRFIACLGG